MSRSKSSKINPLKRFWNLLFKPSMPLYQDEPKRPSTARKSATVSKSASVGGKSSAKQRVQAKKKSKTKVADSSLLTDQELGERIGFVDKLGVVRLKATSKEVGRISVGQGVEQGVDLGIDRENALGAYVKLYKDHESALLAFKNKEDTLSAEDFGEINRIKLEIKDRPGLGDVNKLNELIEGLASQLESNASKLRSDKIRLLQEIDKLPMASANGDIDWTAADNKLSALTEEWNLTAKLDEKAQSGLDHRLEATLRAFKDRKYNFYNDYDGNKKLKEHIIRRAENLTTAADVDEAKATFESLENQWRSVGAVANGEEAMLRERLEQAKRDFTIANADRLSEQEERRGHLLKRKAEMALDLEGLIMSDDPRSLFDAVRKNTNTLEQIQKHLGEDAQTADLNAKLEAIEQKANLLLAKTAKVREAEIVEAKAIVERAAIVSNAAENGLSWKEADSELAELHTKAKSFSHISRDLNSHLRQTLSEATKDLVANRTAFYERLDEEREVNSSRKRALINDLPFYKSGATSVELVAHLSTSMESWKKIGPANRDINDKLWDEYREVRDVLFERVNELRSLEKDDFADRLAGAFSRKREALSKLELEVSHEGFLIENMSDEKKAAKMKSALKRQKKRVSDLQTDILDIQRKLAKMSSAKKKAAEVEGSATPDVGGSASPDNEKKYLSLNEDTSQIEGVTEPAGDVDPATA